MKNWAVYFCLMSIETNVECVRKTDRDPGRTSKDLFHYKRGIWRAPKNQNLQLVSAEQKEENGVLKLKSSGEVKVKPAKILNKEKKLLVWNHIKEKHITMGNDNNSTYNNVEIFQ